MKHTSNSLDPALEEWEKELFEDDNRQLPGDQLEILEYIGKLQESLDDLSKKQKIINTILLGFIVMVIIAFSGTLYSFGIQFLSQNIEGFLVEIISSIILVPTSIFVYRKYL